MKIDVKQIAYLARLDLGEQDQRRMAGELETVLAHMRNLLKVDVEGVPPTFTLGDVNCLQLAEDAPHESLRREVVMESAPSVLNGYFKVPRESQGV
ncbi:MAG TPA: Asp-tRNA(Asn)/Glu-tRNA(Gln) amidotransferase subunit GatC [Firmicutes bacterium]|nr:Asp-tRNA(Asn)/Glu-tRNA(Gln) amidotransferase subunit GatC [Candidatus Fermentithermobacillaceae bacterium]